MIFDGTDGYVVCPATTAARPSTRTARRSTKFNGGGDEHHFDNFLKAVRSRKHEDLNADIEEGHLSSALCHLGNICYRLGDMPSKDACLERIKAIKTTENVTRRWNVSSRT